MFIYRMRGKCHCKGLRPVHGSHVQSREASYRAEWNPWDCKREAQIETTTNSAQGNIFNRLNFRNSSSSRRENFDCCVIERPACSGESYFILHMWVYFQTCFSLGRVGSVEFQKCTQKPSCIQMMLHLLTLTLTAFLQSVDSRPMCWITHKSMGRSAHNDEMDAKCSLSPLHHPPTPSPLLMTCVTHTENGNIGPLNKTTQHSGHEDWIKTKLVIIVHEKSMGKAFYSF